MRSVLSFALLVAFTGTSGARTTAVKDAILREVARVDREMKAVVPADQRASADAHLRRAAAAAERDRLFLALHELSTPWRLQAAFSFTAARSTRVKTLDDFTREWTAAGAPPGPGPADDLPAAVAALATSSESTGPATYRASRPYAADTTLEGGLIYLGDAHAGARFGTFCRSLAFERAGSRPLLRAISAEMDRFERDVTRLYESADAATRRTFIPISVAMKIARERDAAGDHAAALLQYLLAREQLGTLVTAEAAADAAIRLEKFSKALSDADHTIARLFLEMAFAGLESSDARAKRSATAIADFVLPAYVEIVNK